MLLLVGRVAVLAQQALDHHPHLRPCALAQVPVDGRVAPDGRDQLLRDLLERDVAEHGHGAVVGLEGVVEGQPVVAQAELVAAALGLAHFCGQLDQLFDHRRRRDVPVLVLDYGALQHLREAPRLDEVAAEPHLDLVLEQLLEQLHGQVAPRHVADLGEEAVVEHRDVGSLQTGDREDVDHLVARHGLGDDLAHGQVELLVTFHTVARCLHDRGAHALEEAHVVADRQRLGAGQRQREGPAQPCDGSDEALLPVVKVVHELLGVADGLQLLFVGAATPRRRRTQNRAACRRRPRTSPASQRWPEPGGSPGRRYRRRRCSRGERA